MDYISLLYITDSSEEGSAQELKSEFLLNEGWTGVTPIADLNAFSWHSSDLVWPETRLLQELFQFLEFGVYVNVLEAKGCCFSA